MFSYSFFQKKKKQQNANTKTISYCYAFKLDTTLPPNYSIQHPWNPSLELLSTCLAGMWILYLQQCLTVMCITQL